MKTKEELIEEAYPKGMLIDGIEATNNINLTTLEVLVDIRDVLVLIKDK